MRFVARYRPLSPNCWFIPRAPGDLDAFFSGGKTQFDCHMYNLRKLLQVKDVINLVFGVQLEGRGLM